VLGGVGGYKKKGWVGGAYVPALSGVTEEQKALEPG
jgi:hypothetical protein